MKNMKKVLAVVLSVMLLISVMPMAVFAGNVADVADQTSLQAAIDNANDGDTIRFVADTDYSTARIYVIDGKSITLIFMVTPKNTSSAVKPPSLISQIYLY